jgi:hypothetical protein
MHLAMFTKQMGWFVGKGVHFNPWGSKDKMLMTWLWSTMTLWTSTMRDGEEPLVVVI